MSTTLGEVVSQVRNQHLYDVRIGLTPNVDETWRSIFNALWSKEFYNMKRRAHAERDAVVVTCSLDEILEHHYPRLKEVVNRTDEEYDMLMAEKAAKEDKERQEKETADKKALEEQEKINKEIRNRENRS